MENVNTGQSFIKPHFQNLASSRAMLRGFTAEIDREAGRAENAVPYPAMTAQHILLVRSDTQRDTRLEWTMNGSRRDRAFITGELILNPSGLLTRPQWSHTVDLRVLAIDPELLVDASQFGSRGTLELIPRYGFRDELLARLLCAMTEELRQSAPDTMYAESLAAAAAQHLIRHYAARPSSPVRTRNPALSAKIQHTLHEYMRAHLGKRITLAELAAMAGVSTSHFTRIFRQSTGEAPHQRLVAMRLRRAEELLRSSSFTLAEVAAMTGFADQSHLTRLFHRHRGVTPHLFRRNF